MQNIFENIRNPRGMKSSPLLCSSSPESKVLNSEVPDWLLRMSTRKARHFPTLEPDLDPPKKQDHAEASPSEPLAPLPHCCWPDSYNQSGPAPPRGEERSSEERARES